MLWRKTGQDRGLGVLQSGGRGERGFRIEVRKDLIEMDYLSQDIKKAKEHVKNI